MKEKTKYKVVHIQNTDVNIISYLRQSIDEKKYMGS